MTEAPIDPAEAGGDDDADRESVEHERAELREFVKRLTPDDVKSGNWFTKLLAQALSSYTNKVDWQYFQEKYQGVPADGIVEERIKMASRYAALEGGLSAAAYSAAVAATIGSGGGASPTRWRLSMEISPLAKKTSSPSFKTTAAESETRSTYAPAAAGR
jgi:hypothetical protein